MEKRIAALALALIPGLGACSAAIAVQESEKQSMTIAKLNKSQVRFTERLLDRITAAAPTDNVFVSPLSINLALSMLREGAKGTSRTEINTALGSDSLSSEEWSSVLPMLKSPNILISNGLWTSKQYSVNNSFIEALQQRFSAEAEGINFENDDAAEHINKWITNSTKGMIPGQLTPMALRNQVLFLINAIAFEDTWQTQFMPDGNEKGTFALAGGKTSPVTYMNRFLFIPYKKYSSYESVSLSYVTSGYAMNIILPSPGVTPMAALKKAISGTAKPTQTLNQGMVTIPKWEGRATYDLKKILSGMGLNSIFQGGEANLSGIGSKQGDYFVSSIVHRTFVQVNESGTKAAATTEIMLGSAGIPVTDFHFKADRPFAYTLTGPHGELLFVGIMNNPAL
ncbi:MAG: hypothetical protein J0L72_02280 [Armatimonadetes bacterium]|nr:hypothetical protein [Armatimonadota bacterium]